MRGEDTLSNMALKTASLLFLPSCLPSKSKRDLPLEVKRSLSRQDSVDAFIGEARDEERVMSGQEVRAFDRVSSADSLLERVMGRAEASMRVRAEAEVAKASEMSPGTQEDPPYPPRCVRSWDKEDSATL